ncbi:hypothetical protein GCM10009639_54980 [Kitasatospora putterlickiae]|uniref:Uncharacterized protein n=1 Tax=Kitasatospora putterlickiae TaxID=221725 RepID=A0ABN1YG20_9ACTN
MARVLTRTGFPAFAATERTVRAAEACPADPDLAAATRRGPVDQLDTPCRAFRSRSLSEKWHPTQVRSPSGSRGGGGA